MHLLRIALRNHGFQVLCMLLHVTRHVTHRIGQRAQFTDRAGLGCLGRPVILGQACRPIAERLQRTNQATGDKQREKYANTEATNAKGMAVEKQNDVASKDRVHSKPITFTNTPEEDFILDRRGPITVCSPCSGHGFKFVPTIGKITAELALGGKQTTPQWQLSN